MIKGEAYFLLEHSLLCVQFSDDPRNRSFTSKGFFFPLNSKEKTQVSMGSEFIVWVFWVIAAAGFVFFLASHGFAQIDQPTQSKPKFKDWSECI